MQENKWLVPNLYTEAGTMRRVGVEIEFDGLTLPKATEIVAAWAGETAVSDTAAQGHVNTRWGPLRTEIDWLYLKNLAKEKKIAPNSSAWVDLLSQVAAHFVPIEVVSPPIPLDQVVELEALVERLRRAGASGTGSSPIAAFGVHLNPELPASSAAPLAFYIQAFGLLQWWLKRQAHLDITRRLSPYIDLYPETYVLLSLTYAEHTTMEHMRQDYLEHNASRNRALDLWPIFADFDEQWVQRELKEPLIKPRPTFHYRLPNCEIDDPRWTLLHCWWPWQVVERLAASPEKLALLAEHFQLAQRSFRGAHKNDWVDFLDQWLNDQSLV